MIAKADAEVGYTYRRVANVALTLRDRFALAGRAIAGSLPLGAGSVGERLLAGVIPAGGAPPERGTKEILASYSTMPWLRAVASRISYDVAATEWQLLVPMRQGRAVRDRALQKATGDPVTRARLVESLKATGELQVVENHPLSALIDDANPMQTGLAARRVTQIHLDLVGEAFWLIERGVLDQPAAVWPVPPNWILATPRPNYPFFRVSFRGWQGQIPVSEFVWFLDADPANPYARGSGTARSLSDELETDEYAAKHLKSFFLNHARPDIIVWPKGEQPLQEPEVRRLEERWNRENRGFWRAWKPFFLRREVEIKELDQGNFRSMQMVALREYERDSILQVFGVSPETLGIITPGASRATIAMGDQIYSRRVLVPRLETWRSILQERVAPLFDERLVLHYVSPVIRDRELELDAAKTATWAVTVDEWRGRAGFEPLPDGKGAIHLVPFGQQVVRDFDELAALPEPEPMPPLLPPANSEGRGEEPEMRDRLGAEAQVLAERDAQVCASAGDAKSAMALRKFIVDARDQETPVPTRIADAQVHAYRRSQEAAWKALSQRADREALARAIAAQDEEAVLAAFGGDSAVAAALVSVLRARGLPVFLRGAQLALEGLPANTREPINISLTAVNPAATAWAEAEAAKLVVANADTRAAIRSLIVESNEQGLSPAEVARRLIDENIIGLTPRQVQAVSRFRDRLWAQTLDREVIARRTARYAQAQLRLRAMNIARTELVGAVNAGQEALWDLARTRHILPEGTTRVWLATMDDRLDSEICEPLADTEAKLGEPFKGGYMHPPAHPSCRCAVGIGRVPR